MPETRKRKARRTKMVAVQEMFLGGNEQRIVVEGEVFMHVGPELPHKDIAMRAPDGAPVGKPPLGADGTPSKDAPDWTTQGFVKKAHAAAAKGEDDNEDT